MKLFPILPNLQLFPNLKKQSTTKNTQKQRQENGYFETTYNFWHAWFSLPNNFW